MRINKPATPVVESRFRNSSDMIVGRNGEINAGSKQELMTRLVEIAGMIQDGEVFDNDGNSQDRDSLRAERASAIREAINDPKEWAELGSALAAEIDERLEREGFMRSVLFRGDVQEGAVPRVRIKERHVTAIRSRGVGMIYPQYVRDSYLFAEEFYVTSTPRVELIEIHQGNSDVLEEKYFQGMEQIFVQEDRHVINMMRTADGIANDVTYFNGTWSQSNLVAVKENVDRWRIPATTCIASIDLINDAIGGSSFSSWFDPITKWEIIKTGRIGNLLGMSIITDGYRDKNLQVLDRGEFIICGAPEFLGAYTDRGPVNATPIDEFEKFVPARGWSLNEVISATIGNAKAIARGKRN